MNQRKALRLISKSTFKRFWNETTWTEEIEIDGFRPGHWLFTKYWGLTLPPTTPAKIRTWFEEVAANAPSTTDSLCPLLQSLNKRARIEPLTFEKANTKVCVVAYLEGGPHVLFEIPEPGLTSFRAWPVRGVHVDLMLLFAVVSPFVQFQVSKGGIILAEHEGEVFGLVAPRLVDERCAMSELLGRS